MGIMKKPAASFLVTVCSLPVMLSAGLLLTGCASLSEQECRTADWRMIGYEDGVVGRQARRLAAHREACADYDVTPDMEGYRLGREEGLREYCQPQRIYQLGLRGRAYPAVCPSALEVELRPAYRQGLEIHDAQSTINDLRNDLAQTEQELEDIDAEFADNQIEIISDETTQEHRLQLLAESWKLVKRRDALEHESEFLQEQLADKRRQLEDLQSHNRYR